ncbi:MAG: PaaI family thioesterase [Acidimicrobiales bacterium]
MSALQVPPNCDLTLGMVCVEKSEPGRTVWTMTADERFSNTAGILQGGFLGAFADSAMGASAVTFSRATPGRKVFVANAEMKTSFLRAVPVGTVLTCEATVVSGGERVVFCEATIRDGSDRLVGKASSTYVITPRD